MNFKTNRALFDHLLYHSLPLGELGVRRFKLDKDNSVIRELNTINGCAQESEVVWIIRVRFNERHELLGQLSVTDRL